jgi:protein-disulfide isomerase
MRWCPLIVSLLVALAVHAAEPVPRAPVDLRDRPVLGRDTAPIVVVEISSFKCAHCREFHQKVFPQLRAAYIDTGKVQWTMLNASDDPADQHSQIFTIARCAQRQGKYWELLDHLFAVANRPPSFLADLVAKSPLIDRADLEIGLRDRAVRNAVAADFADYARLKSRGTPTFRVTKIGAGGERTEITIAGLKSFEHFQEAFDQLLKSP